MNRYLAAFAASAALLSGLSIAHAQEPGTAETTGLAIPVVRVNPSPPAPPPPRITGAAEIVRAKFPLAIKFSELGTGWRALEWGSLYFTRGETTLVNNDEYLVAYVARASTKRSELDTRAYIRAITTQQQSFLPEDRFPITLLRMQNIVSAFSNGSTGLRSFSAEEFRQTFDPPLESAAYRQNLSLVYLRKIFEAVNKYSSTYLNMMPPMHTAFAARQALLPFAENDVIFNQPGTTTPYKANPLLSERKREHLRTKARLIIFYEGEPAADGSRGVLFLDGRTQRLNEESWRRLSRASDID